MRICHIVGTNEGWGGLERSVVDLATLQSASHEVKVLGGGSIIDRLPSSVPAFRLPLHLNRRDPRLWWTVYRELRSFRPQVIHAHANKAASLANVVRPFLPRAARVATVQNTKRSTRVFASFDQVIAVSRKAGQTLGIPHHVIWNAIPKPPPISPGNADELPFLGQGRPVLIAVGRLVPAKGFDLLIPLLRDLDVCLWIVGNGPLQSELETLAASAGVSDRVWFAGFRKDVDWLMTQADVMVISSRNEGFPFVLVEALRRRRPVVSTKIGGADEVLPPEWLCECNDPAGLSALLHRAVERLPHLETDFEQVFSLAERDLALESSSQRIAAVYREAAARAGVA